LLPQCPFPIRAFIIRYLYRSLSVEAPLLHIRASIRYRYLQKSKGTGKGKGKGKAAKRARHC
jgi:hypothetical protein